MKDFRLRAGEEAFVNACERLPPQTLQELPPGRVLPLRLAAIAPGRCDAVQQSIDGLIGGCACNDEDAEAQVDHDLSL